MQTALKNRHRSSPIRAHARGDDRSCSPSAIQHRRPVPQRTKGRISSRNCAQLESCSRDPIGYVAGDMDLYTYVGGRVAVLVDPSGMLESPVHQVNKCAVRVGVRCGAVAAPLIAKGALCVSAGYVGYKCGRQQGRYIEWACDRIPSDRGPIPPLDKSDPRHPDHKTETEPKPKRDDTPSNPPPPIRTKTRQRPSRPVCCAFVLADGVRVRKNPDGTANPHVRPIYINERASFRAQMDCPDGTLIWTCCAAMGQLLRSHGHDVYGDAQNTHEGPCLRK